MKFFIIFNWTLWSILPVALICALIMLLTERSRRAEAGSTLGVFLVAVGLAFSAATGLALHRLVQKPSLAGLILMTLVLIWPLVPLIARPISAAFKNWKEAHHKNVTGHLSSL